MQPGPLNEVHYRTAAWQFQKPDLNGHALQVPPGPDPVPSDKWFDRIVELAQRLDRAETEHREAAAALAEALHLGHSAGLTWTAIAEAAGLSNAETARSRSYRGRRSESLSPSVRWKHERGSTQRHSEDAPGVSVTEAATQLGVTRKTVYAWIDKGKLAATTDEGGRTRVLLED